MHNNALLSPSDQPKVRCYGANAALTVEATPLMVKGVPDGHTVNLDVAPRQGENVIWAQKITIQLSDTELPILAAVCLGFLPKAAARCLPCPSQLARRFRFLASFCRSCKNNPESSTALC